MYADSEMAVMRATGISEWYVARVTLVLAITMMVIAGINSLWLGPWAQEREYQVMEQAQADAGLSTLASGRFQYASNNKSVIYVESMQDGKLSKIFVAQLPSNVFNPEHNVIVAANGDVIEEEMGSQQLKLSNGKRYQVAPGKAAYSSIEFNDYQMQIKEQAVEQRRRKLSAIPTAQLWARGDVEAMAEIQWRISIPLTIPLLALIAVPLARVNPRQGKFAKLFPAILLFLGYYLLLMAGRSALDDGIIPINLGLWWIHLSALILGFALLSKERQFGVVIRAKLRGHKA